MEEDFDDKMGWALFSTPKNESEQKWMDTLQLNFSSTNVHDKVEIEMSLRLFQILGRVPEIPAYNWSSFKIADKDIIK